MNHQGQILRSSRRPLWECILGRYMYRGRLLRPRVPLVFRRVSSPESFYQRPRVVTPVVQYPLNLHLQVSWPLLSMGKTRIRETIRQSSAIRRHLQRTSAQAPGRALDQAFGQVLGQALVQATPARVQLSSLIKSYAIVTAQRSQFHTASTVFKSAGRVPLPSAPAALDHTTHTNIRNAFTYSGPNPRFSTNVEVHHREIKVESGRTSADGEDPARETLPEAFPEVVITSRRRIIAERDIVTPRSLVTALAPPNLRHQTETENQPSNIRRRETLSHTNVFHSSRVHVDTASPPVSAGVTTHASRTARTESAQGFFVPPQQRLYWQPAAREFASVPSHADEKQSTQQDMPSMPPQRASVPQPTLDIGQLSEEVYRHIQRKLRIERERRGL